MNYIPTVLVGPSGVGKGTLLDAVCASYPQVWISVSATTRKPRPGEVHGQHYFFLTDQEFDDLIAGDGFLEWAQYQSSRYGTPSKAVDRQIRAGQAVVMEVEIQGALQIMEKLSPLRTIFVIPPSMDELVRRLRARGTETEEAIAARVATARQEMALTHRFDHIIVNEELAEATQELVNLLGLSTE
ncbi:MAG: guanylate kinase [Propionibacteriaceae bacterium]|nr:guanylate kinase [Propionibacteriaceae bacterium]